MKFILSLFVIVAALLLGYLIFTSDYANTDYYKPLFKIIISQPEPLKLYLTADDCYLNKSNFKMVNSEQDLVELIYFQRDLRDGSACFKLAVNKKIIGFTPGVAEKSIDSIRAKDQPQLFKKTLWIWWR